jgi:nitric oxide reductase large subunit
MKENKMLKNRLIVIGFFCVLTGAVLPFLILTGVVESTFLMNAIAYTTSTVGIFLGVIGTATWVGDQKRKDDWHDDY